MPSLVPGQIIEAHRAELIRFISKRISCPDATLDIFHDTFVRYSHYSQKAEIEHHRAFLFRIAANLVVDYQRLSVNRLDHDTDEYTLHSIEDSVQDLEQQCEHQQRLEAINKAMHELPEKCRQAFYLHRIEGYTHAEIAEKLRLSESMVGKHLVRAMKHCSDFLKQNSQ